jgi:hypothetical protein
MDLRIPAAAVEAMPRWLGIVLVSMLGPALILAWGLAAWKVFAAACLGVMSCLGFAYFCWHRYPESDVFAIPLIAAAAIWIASAWVAVAVGI